MNTKQLELEGVPRKRVRLITEPACAPKEEPVVADLVSVSNGHEYFLCQVTAWFPNWQNPPRPGYWDVRPPGGQVDRKVWFDPTHGWAWSFLESRKFEWRGLMRPAPGGYTYYVEGAHRRRVRIG